MVAWCGGVASDPCEPGYGTCMVTHIGTSGWHYADWRGRFYPQGLAQRKWLERYASSFETVEVNNAFYRLPEASTFEQWRASTVTSTDRPALRMGSSSPSKPVDT